MKAVLVALVAVCAFLLVACGAGRHMIDPDDTPLVEASHENDYGQGPVFFIESRNKIDEGKGMLEIIVTIQLKSLLALAVNGERLRHYEIEASLYLYDLAKQKKGARISFISFRDSVLTSPEEKIDDLSQTQLIHFKGTEGTYFLETEVTDLATRKSNIREIPVMLRLTKAFDISSVLFFYYTKKDTLIRIILADSRAIDPNLNVSAWTELYLPDSLSQKTVLMFYSVKSVDLKKTFIEKVDTLKVKGKINKIFIPLKDVSDIDLGQYVLTLYACSSDSHEISYMINKPFVLYSLIPRTEKDMAAFFEPFLEIVAPHLKSEFKDATREKKVELFLKFWKSEKEMDDFYKRVGHANAHFKTRFKKHKGWQTDMGRIFIKYGAPDTEEFNPQVPFRRLDYEGVADFKKWEYWHSLPGCSEKIPVIFTFYNDFSGEYSIFEINQPCRP